MDSSRALRVMIVDDHEVVRTGLMKLIEREPDMIVVGAASTASAAISMAMATRPDVALLDYWLPDSNGADVCAQLIEARPSLAVVVLTSDLDDNVLLASLAAGARGFLTKTSDPTGIPDTLRKVIRGEAVLAPETIVRVLDWAKVARARATGQGTLAPFELEILKSLSVGQTVRSIALDLRVSEDSIRGSLRSIRRRLGASDRAHAVALAIKKGLI